MHEKQKAIFSGFILMLIFIIILFILYISNLFNFMACNIVDRDTVRCSPVFFYVYIILALIITIFASYSYYKKLISAAKHS
jgi:uncharacterized membrane protein